ncbi:hypothetical protein COZ40_02585, partial [Candidatus Roizmanbacteria bacterium CG_4_10_14_3_um_filter_39_13]
FVDSAIIVPASLALVEVDVVFLVNVFEKVTNKIPTITNNATTSTPVIFVSFDLICFSCILITINSNSKTITEGGRQMQEI